MRAAGPFLFAALLVLSASGAAHVTTTVDPVAGPLVVGQPTEITLRFSEPCAELLLTPDVSELTAGLMPDTPASVAWSGETVDFSVDMCDPTAVPLALVRATAKLTITPSASLPGLTNLTLQATSYANGEAGEPTDFTVRVGYYANATVRLGPAVGTGATVTLPVTLTYSANAATSLTLAATATSGSLTGLPATTPLASTAELNQTTVPRTFNATFASAGAPSKVTVTATLAPQSGGAGVPFTATLALPALGNTTGDGHDHTHDESSEPKKTPLPLPVLLVAVVGALVVARRRFA